MAGANWIAVSAIIVLSCGIMLLAKALIGTVSLADRDGARRAWQQRVDAVMSLPYLAAGMLLLLAAQFVHSEIGPLSVLLALSAALGLIIYVGVEGLVVDHCVQRNQVETSNVTAASSMGCAANEGQELATAPRLVSSS